MVEFLVKQINKYISTWVPKSKVMSNQSLIFFEDITKWVDDGSPVDVQKAFDKVPHQRLLLKLKAHGIGNDEINWIETWLTHRRQSLKSQVVILQTAQS